VLCRFAGLLLSADSDLAWNEFVSWTKLGQIFRRLVKFDTQSRKNVLNRPHVADITPNASETSALWRERERPTPATLWTASWIYLPPTPAPPLLCQTNTSKQPSIHPNNTSTPPSGLAMASLGVDCGALDVLRLRDSLGLGVLTNIVQWSKSIPAAVDTCTSSSSAAAPALTTQTLRQNAHARRKLWVDSAVQQLSRTSTQWLPLVQAEANAFQTAQDRTAVGLKEKGNALLTKGDLQSVVQIYSAALLHAQDKALRCDLLSNRSLSLLQMQIQMQEEQGQSDVKNQHYVSVALHDAVEAVCAVPTRAKVSDRVMSVGRACM
jgi:hypothetical protein